MTQDHSKAGQGEAQVVLGQQLAAQLQAWRDLWLSERDPYLREHGQPTEDNLVMGPLSWLHEKTGIPKRRIYEYMNGRQQFVGLSQADKLLNAIDAFYLLGHVIHVIPNPHWPIEKWIAFMEERGCI